MASRLFPTPSGLRNFFLTSLSFLHLPRVRIFSGLFPLHYCLSHPKRVHWYRKHCLRYITVNNDDLLVRSCHIGIRSIAFCTLSTRGDAFWDRFGGCFPIVLIWFLERWMTCLHFKTQKIGPHPFSNLTDPALVWYTHTEAAVQALSAERRNCHVPVFEPVIPLAA